ncbi:MAG: WYL domain-containing protein [Chloroflexi bacterium]|nr:WYL domain-containing protein [Chloroflexota bacterium]
MFDSWTSGEPRLEETKRLARVLRIIQLVAGQPRCWSRRRLAAEFEVAERTIDADLQLIRHGLRYGLCRGQGGYYLTNSPIVKPVQLSLPEAVSLAIAAQQARDTGTVDAGSVAAALAQLEGALPPGVVPYLRQAASGDSFTPSTPARDRWPILSALERAMGARRTVRITYASASREGALSERDVAPYHLLPHDRSWFLIGYDSLRDDIRMFNVDRIQRCSILPDRYAVPEDFDLSAYLGSTWGVLRGEEGPTEDVEIVFTPEAARWVAEVRWHHTQTTETLPGGDLVVRFRCTVTHELIRWALSYGPRVRIRAPSTLREAVLREARELLELHRTTAAAATGEGMDT